MAWVIAFLEAGWLLQWMDWDTFREAILNKSMTVFRDFSYVKRS